MELLRNNTSLPVPVQSNQSLNRILAELRDQQRINEAALNMLSQRLYPDGVKTPLTNREPQISSVRTNISRHPLTNRSENQNYAQNYNQLMSYNINNYSNDSDIYKNNSLDLNNELNGYNVKVRVLLNSYETNNLTNDEIRYKYEKYYKILINSFNFEYVI